MACNARLLRRLEPHRPVEHARWNAPGGSDPRRLGQPLERGTRP